MTFLLALALLSAPPDVAVLRWSGPEGTAPLGFRDWAPGHADWSIRTLHRTPGSFNDRVDVLVEDSLVAPLAAALDTLVADLESESYNVGLYSVSGTVPESLRAFLQAEYDSGLVAAVFVGDLPVAWYQLIDDWNNNGIREDDEHYEEFPCDLYYMDLNGTWQDTMKRYGNEDSLVPGADGIYDVHDGDVAPEIGISRMPASAVGNEDSLINAYLDRAHRYRDGRLAVTDRALVYIDDDWIPNAWFWDRDVGLLYADRVSMWHQDSTRAADYRPRMDSAAHESVLLCAHSWPGGHVWTFAQGDSHDRFYAHEIPQVDPEACFYNLFACSNARFVEPGNCGARYVFETDHGLGAIGSAKTGSMLEFGDFYGPLANGYTLAGAFRYWFTVQANGGYNRRERSWFYGMCLLGDGLLRPRLNVAVAEEPPGMTGSPRILSVSSPARDEVSCAVSVRSPGRVTIALLDCVGRVRERLHDGRLEPGTHRFKFRPASLPAGVWFLGVTTTGGSASSPVQVVR